MHAMTVDVAVSGQEQNSTTSNTIAGLAAQMLSGEERDDLLEARRPFVRRRRIAEPTVRQELEFVEAQYAALAAAKAECDCLTAGRGAPPPVVSSKENAIAL